MSKIGNAWRRTHGAFTGKPTNFSWVIPDVLAGSGRPMSKDEFQWLLEQRVTAIVSMTETALPGEWTQKVSYLHVPTVDMTAPTLQDIDKAVNFIHEQSRRGSVTVHCAAGLGRAGTILACYHIKHLGYDAESAIRHIRKTRPGSIQSEIQEIAVSRYQHYCDTSE